MRRVEPSRSNEAQATFRGIEANNLFYIFDFQTCYENRPSILTVELT